MDLLAVEDQRHPARPPDLTEVGRQRARAGRVVGRVEQDKLGWKPVLARPRKISAALKAYALLATSADKGAVRDLSMLD